MSHPVRLEVEDNLHVHQAHPHTTIPNPQSVQKVSPSERKEYLDLLKTLLPDDVWGAIARFVEEPVEPKSVDSSEMRVFM